MEWAPSLVGLCEHGPSAIRAARTKFLCVALFLQEESPDCSTDRLGTRHRPGVGSTQDKRAETSKASLIRRVNSSEENSGPSAKSESDGRQQKMDAAYSAPSSLNEVYGPLGHIHNHY
jgi:hypothetical protein